MKEEKKKEKQNYTKKIEKKLKWDRKKYNYRKKDRN